ncbi:hypothetical protein I7I51_03643 [Histoplasma capsulatum]|uniref:Uncharacterized protein n=1 Tax=Ajellomyces capsulatus TaxID=5037 RepID=A0A8A1M4R4_AJECA|nr:hypothetical protein I7I51_03643 [Histoplasma capsulatum]
MQIKESFIEQGVESIGAGDYSRSCMPKINPCKSSASHQCPKQMMIAFNPANHWRWARRDKTAKSSGSGVPAGIAQVSVARVRQSEPAPALQASSVIFRGPSVPQARVQR